MRRAPTRQERLAGLFVVLGSAGLFGPVVWLLERWREALARDPASAWGARWLGEQPSANPYAVVDTLLLGAAFSGGPVMLILVVLAKRLAARLTDRARSGRRGTPG